MRKLIKQLEPQCWEINEFGALTFNYEKYAEMIVKECIDEFNTICPDRPYVVNLIKKRLGIEE